MVQIFVYDFIPMKTIEVCGLTMFNVVHEDVEYFSPRKISESFDLNYLDINSVIINNDAIYDSAVVMNVVVEDVIRHKEYLLPIDMLHCWLDCVSTDNLNFLQWRNDMVGFLTRGEEEDCREMMYSH